MFVLKWQQDAFTSLLHCLAITVYQACEVEHDLNSVPYAIWTAYWILMVKAVYIRHRKKKKNLLTTLLLSVIKSQSVVKI